MKNKIITISVIFLIISLFSSVCFAESNTVDLKNEINNSLDKTRNTVTNVTDDIVSGTNVITNGVMQGGNAIRNGITNMTNDNNYMDNNNDNNNENNSMTNTQNTGNNNDTTVGYNVTRTAIGDAYDNSNQMNQTTWLWIIIAIAGIIIVGSVWYYAMQGNNGRNDED